MQKLNVLLTTTSLGIGCTEKTVQIFAKYLDKELFNVSICCLDKGGLRESIIKEYGIPVFIMNNDIAKFKELLNKIQFHILHVNTLPFEFIEYARALVPIIIETSVFGYYNVFEFQEKYIDKILFVSKMIASRYRKKMSLTYDKMEILSDVIYNPIDLETVESDVQLTPDQFRNELGIKSDAFVIGKIGRKDRTKWSNFLIDSIKLLQRKYKNFKVILVGAPSEIINEIKRAKLGDFFILINQISEEKLKIFYKTIDCLVHSSKIGESFGCTLAEAMALQKPVIVNSTPIRDNAQIEVVDNNKTGFVVLYPETCVQAILRIINNRDLRIELGKNGFQKVNDQFNAKVLTKYLEKIYLIQSFKKNLIARELLSRHQEIHIKSDISELPQFEHEYQLRLEDCYGRLTELQQLKYLFKTGFQLIVHILKNILSPICILPLALIKNYRRKKEILSQYKTGFKFSAKKVNYFLFAILRRKYYEILFI